MKTAVKEMSPFGKIIAVKIFEEGMSQADLSRTTGLSTAHMSKIIKGQCEPKPETVKKLSKALDLPIEQIVEVLYR